MGSMVRSGPSVTCNWYIMLAQERIKGNEKWNALWNVPYDDYLKSFVAIDDVAALRGFYFQMPDVI